MTSHPLLFDNVAEHLPVSGAWPNYLSMPFAKADFIGHLLMRDPPTMSVGRLMLFPVFRMFRVFRPFRGLAVLALFPLFPGFPTPLTNSCVTRYSLGTLMHRPLSLEL